MMLEVGVERCDMASESVGSRLCCKHWGDGLKSLEVALIVVLQKRAIRC